MKIRWPTLMASALALACMTTASADDGEKVLKRMTPNSQQLTVTPEELGLAVAESEHAFIDMMKFYVPAQMASGAQDSTDNENIDLGVYKNIDDIEVEYLPVAKPLVSVFIHGPAIGVGDLPFAHSFMDAYGAVSLDDGLTWKTTNLSLSADQSSFTLGQSGGGDGDDHHDVPADHNQIEKKDDLSAFHARGMDYPYTNECTECHGPALQGGHHKEPSCYSCHGPVWKEDAPDGITVVFIEEATAKTEKEKVKLKVNGAVEGADRKATATLINGVTEAFLDTTTVEDNGKFHFEAEYHGIAPCTIVVVVEGIESSVVPVVDKKTGEELETCEGEPHDFTEYPGGVHNVFHATAGNKVLVAWPSRYCDQGKPAYSLGNNDETELARVVDFIKTGQAADGTTLALPGFSLEDDLYLVDAFGVAGSQKSSDLADEGYPEVGEVPYSCVWAARGVMLPGDDLRTDEYEMSHMAWTKAERLTSGRRDPFRIEVKAVLDKDGPYEGGFAITWQEDPDGLRPGDGEGPGEGWSGAVAHRKTDIWYSFINMEYFDYVLNEVDGTAINIATHDLSVSGRPKAFVPMAVPMRLTNNDKCKVADDVYGEPVIVDTALYCHHEDAIDVLGDGILRSAADYGIKNQCMDTVEIPTGPNDELKPICVSEDGLPNIANTGSTRPRLSLQPSDHGSAWVVVAAEESKGLGAFFYLPDGTPCEEGSSLDCQEEIGKNQWYFSFDMGTPDTSASAADSMLGPTSLVKNLVSQGNMLNQPEVDWRTGAFYGSIDTGAEDTWNFGTYGFEIWNTEIARRSSLLVQSTAKAGKSGVVAISSWKQGPMKQGGPADTMMRRFIAGKGPSINPYDFTNIDCDTWDPVAGANPYYPGGVCVEPATNLSSVTPDTCFDTATNIGAACPTVNGGIGDTNPILQGYIQGEGNTQKVLTWHQCPSAGAPEGDIDAATCGADDTNLTDQSWYNPLDVSKGHRGFLDGDMVMFMYGWSPNWRLNAKGHDRYDLYIRRSFDGGVTWTTTPSSGTASDGTTPFAGNGTTTCETYRSLETQASGEIPEPQVCYTYPAGGAEQARNVTQHSRMKVTTLDPRYAPTSVSIPLNCLDFTDPTIVGAPWSCDDTSPSLDSDLRDPSRFFIVYETGDNSTVEEGEAEPLDLYYSRAINFGDDYAVWADEVVDATLAACYPNDPHEDEKVVETPADGSGFCNEFDRMNARGDTHSSEANLEANPDGSKLYGVWTQWAFDDLGEEVDETDAMVRRLWWIDNYISANPDLVWTLPGTNKEQ